MNPLHRDLPQLHTSDCDPQGFAWLDVHNAEESVWAFERRSSAVGAVATAGTVATAGVALEVPAHPPLICIVNATPVPREHYVIGVPAPGTYRKIFDSDAARFGGSAYDRQGPP